MLIPMLVQVIGVYVSPKCTFTKFTYLFEELMRNTDHSSTVIMIDDFNMKSVTNLDDNYNNLVERYMACKYQFHQIINENTTNHNSKLDLCFTNSSLHYCHMKLLVRSQNTISSYFKTNIDITVTIATINFTCFPYLMSVSLFYNINVIICL